ncbi:uncharacterized protein LOC108455574 [Gossypium arboreum]|uniref:uncharacterized protein LOC108455574 n=1 Tax=Gossypium arboreum TaxID=29729 RepID=UPI0008196EC6|nr:uncharacterized protein LOC108455574 [Gossypium arboreum]
MAKGGNGSDRGQRASGIGTIQTEYYFVNLGISAESTARKISMISPLEVNLIRRMDWLVEHRFSLDCASKRVTQRYDNDTEIVMIDEHRDYLCNVISIMVLEKLAWKACEAYLAFLSDSGPSKPSIKDIQTVRDFSDVFPEKLPRIPPDREVKFGIELLPCTTPVSIAPYRMAPKELMELKAYL